MKKVFIILLSLLLVFGSTAEAFAWHDATYANQLVTVNQLGYIDEEGGLWLWGDNTYGQAGQDKSISIVAKPAKVMDHVISFDRDDVTTIVLKDDGSVWTFGTDFNHGYYREPMSSVYRHDGSETPYKVGDNAVAVSIGNEKQMGMLKKDGSLWTWGFGTYSALGYNVAYLGDEYFMQEGFSYPDGVPASLRSATCKPKMIMTGVKAFAMAQYGGMAIKNDNSLWYWGSYYDPTIAPDPDHEIPGPTKLMDNVKQFSVGFDGFTCGVVLTDGTAWYWGYSCPGQKVGFKQRKKIADNVAKVVGYQDASVPLPPAGSNLYPENSLFYVLKTDGKLYAKNGTEFVMDNVADVIACEGAYQNGPNGEDLKRDWTFILKKDGTLVARRDILDENYHFSKWQYTTVAEHVALPTQPVSSFRKKIGNFTDVREGDWFAGPVEWAVDRSITAGTTPTTFSPNQTCTTAQILTFLWVAAGQDQPKGDNPFSDVTEANYFYRPALWASENGLVEGDMLGGNAPCTRAAVVTYLWKLAGSPAASSSQFKDVPADADYAQAVAWAVKEGVTAGLSADTFGPDNICTRAQIVTFLKAALD